MVTPPAKDGTVSREVLAAAHIAGWIKSTAWRGAGGGGPGYGTGTIGRVDRSWGPGTSLSRRQAQLTGLWNRHDRRASEILILADKTADPPSLRRHDVAGRTRPAFFRILLCDSGELAGRWQGSLSGSFRPCRERRLSASLLRATARIIVCRDMEEALALMNRIAPEIWRC
jgi:histidinol dehydrogenase